MATASMTSLADEDVLDAVRRSSLSSLDRAVMDRLTDKAVLHEVSAGTTIYRETDPPFIELVVRGLIRAYVGAPNGRTMTIRYCRVGALMGTGTVFNKGGPPARGNLAALTDARLLKLQPGIVRALAESDIHVTRALLSETSARVAEYINELQMSSFAPLRQRLCRHLLDLAAEQQTDARLAARASQEELAAAVGTVREVVVRILRDLRDEGLVRTRRGVVELLDARRLDAETYLRQAAVDL